MADLFDEIDQRMEVFEAYQAWRERRPWRWLPRSIAPVLFRNVFAERELEARHA